MASPQGNVTVVTPTKSMGMGILLTVLFGPLGMLYATIPGAIVMIIISAIVGFLTLGLGLLFTWPICVIWTALSVSSYNKKLISGNQ